MSAKSPFPNYLELPTLVSHRAWDWLRGLCVLAAIVTAAGIALYPAVGLPAFWYIVVPVLPAVFFLAPGLWRNICPMATLNQLPRRLGLSRGISHTQRMKDYSYVTGIALFLVLVSSRKWLFDSSAPATVGLIIFGLAAAFTGGLIFKGKSGWCSSICPMLPVQRLYGQTPFALIANAHCQPCVGCNKNCYDFNPGVAYLADQYDGDRHYVGYRRLFAGLLPGFILAFFSIPPGAGIAAIYLHFALYVAVSLASFYALDIFLRVPENRLTTLYGAVTLNAYYWYASAGWFANVGRLSGLGTIPSAAPWAVRLSLFAVTLFWLARSFGRENLFREQVVQRRSNQAIKLGAGAQSALKHASERTGTELVIAPENRRVPAQAGQTLLELIEGCGARIEAGCRSGVCGADPVAVLDGGEHLSPIADDEQNTLARLGHAGNTRMACCARIQGGSVKIALTPDKAPPVQAAVAAHDPTIGRVVIIGNGIAGVTAADHLRRRHAACNIRIVADENHPLYNRMGITRLIYGRSAMQGLTLMPESWYAERSIEVLLNTAARAIDPATRSVELADGEKLPYDRLILATGSRAALPTLPGWGGPGCFVLRSADDAMDLRTHAQRSSERHGVVIGGGLLGLEAAYALHKLGLRVTVVERNAWLLHRQLDEAGGRILQRYLQSLGLDILAAAAVERIADDSEGRQHLHLKNGSVVAADIIVAAAGNAPNVELARAAGIATARGIVVDAAMRSSDPYVYAVGDSAEFDRRITGLWPVAVEQAEVAACNALGEAREYREPVLSTMLKVVGADVYSMGRFDAGESDLALAIEDQAELRYRKLVLQDGRLVGAILVGWPTLAEPVGKAVKAGRDLSGQLEALRQGDWSAFA